MATYLAIDIGGTAVKSALINEQGAILSQYSIATPATLDDFIAELVSIKNRYQQSHAILGVGISSPGSVNTLNGVISGVSAIPYIHHFDIRKLIEDNLKLPVNIANDANCAALAEGWLGEARGIMNYATVVIGSGIGGGIIQNGKLISGVNQLGGEWGYWILDIANAQTWSELASMQVLVNNATARMGVSLDGREIFAGAQAGDKILCELVDRFIYTNAIGIYNLQHSCDPELILIGGAVSQQPMLIEGLNVNLKKICAKTGHVDINVKACKFLNDANLIGAVYSYIMNR